ncbi:MAG: T9SS type A sorting domain-containing protein [Bacteroidetes bacterium]|nr:T9SS type A sorting domain-containing protein [Bacteroidota bacterium]
MKKYIQFLPIFFKPINKYPLLFLALILLLIQNENALSQLPPEGVIFDDFSYENTDWCSEVDGGCQGNPGNSPVEGSVFGRNIWHTSTTGSTDSFRAWYHYLWQEHDIENFSTSYGTTSFGIDSLSSSTNNYLVIKADSGGTHADDTARQIISGFTARRGTWAARVNFGDLEPPDSSNLIQGFWTHSIALGQASNNLFRWNEIDFEWNNRFNGTDQKYPYLFTGHTSGDVRGSLKIIPEPLYSPAWPHLHPDSSGSPTEGDWSCRFIWDNDYNTSKLLSGSECSDILLQKTVHGYTPTLDPSIILFLQVTDTYVEYEIASYGWDGTIVAESQRSNRIPNLPMASLFSQYIKRYTSSDGTKMASKITEDEEFSIDWFYYSPSTNIGINNVAQHVNFLRTTVGTPRINTTDIELERPYAHLPGNVRQDLLGSGRTTSLSLDFSHNPENMDGGVTDTLIALPPLRRGFFQYSWEYRRITESEPFGNGNWVSLSSIHGGWEAPFTFPLNTDAVEVRVTLNELVGPSDHTVINNDTVSTFTDTFIIVGNRDRNQQNSASEALLNQNYPNPFNSSTEIAFKTLDSGHVNLTIYDVLGRRITELFDGNLGSGSHRMRWDAENLPTGHYFYVLTTPSSSQRKVMLLLK